MTVGKVTETVSIAPLDTVTVLLSTGLWPRFNVLPIRVGCCLGCAEEPWASNASCVLHVSLKRPAWLTLVCNQRSN